jgi:hypothetical protein
MSSPYKQVGKGEGSEARGRPMPWEKGRSEEAGGRLFPASKDREGRKQKGGPCLAFRERSKIMKTS